jgi:hypothetical protein
MDNNFFLLLLQFDGYLKDTFGYLLSTNVLYVLMSGKLLEEFADLLFEFIG